MQFFILVHFSRCEQWNSNPDNARQMTTLCEKQNTKTMKVYGYKEKYVSSLRWCVKELLLYDHLRFEQFE